MKRLSLLIVSLFVLLPVTAAGTYDDIGQPGPFAIGFTSFVLTDNSRSAPNGSSEGRPIPVYVWYPVDHASVDSNTLRAEYPLDMLNMPGLISRSDEWESMGYDPTYQEPYPSGKGPFPVLLVSHGWGVPAWLMTGLATRLASHGFVVAVPYHTGDPLWFGWEPPADHYAMVLWNRPRDLSVVLTNLLERNVAGGNLLHGVIDPSKVAASGWSAGGYAAIALAGGDDTVWDYGLTDAYAVYDGPIPESVPHTPSLPDPRFKVIVTFDGANQELRFEELARVKVPAMGLGEEWNVVQDAQARAHAAYSGHPNYRVDLTGTNHLSFSDFCNGLNIMESRGYDPTWGSVADLRVWYCEGVLPSAESRGLITRYSLAFLKTQLLGEPRYQRMLTPGWALTQETFVEFFVTEKRNPNSIDEQWPSYFIYFPHQPGSQQFRAEKNARHAGHR